MLRKIAGCFGVSLVGAALASSASAQDANVTTGSKSAKLGGEFRSELTYDDHGLQKTDGFKPDKTTTIAVQAVNVKLSGWVNNDTEYGFRFNLLSPAKGVVEYGYGTHWFSKMVGFSFGRMRVHQGGWDNMDGSYRTHVTGVYGDNLAYRSFDDMIALHVMAGGKVTLQILNDVTTATGGSWNKSAHPTWVLGWMGEFGPIKPLFDIGSYDNNKSRWIDVGIKTEMNGLFATLDFYNLSAVDKAVDTSGKAKEATDVATSITLNVGYEVKGSVTPWLYFSTFENKQADDDKLVPARKDSKVNSASTDPATGVTSYGWEDNGVVYGVGVDIHSMGKGWTPYVALTSRSGKFPKATDPTKEETKSEMQVKIGVLGEI